MSTLLCRVKANYAFESSDPSSLNFKEGDSIDVLCKLPSGWWDGWCCGQRGWFPSNYVQVVEDYSCAKNDGSNHSLYLDPSTGEVEFKEDEKTVISNENTAHELDSNLQSHYTKETSADLTYKKLLADISSAIHDLTTAIKNSDSSVYMKYATKVVHTIRFMMISTGTLSKDASVLKINSILRTHHRLLVNIVAKIIFSLQSNQTSQLTAEIQELLLAVRTFMHLCETMECELHRVDPVFISPPDWEHTERYPVSQDASLLETSSECMQKLLKSLATHLSQPADSRSSLAVLLFTQYRDLVTLNRQFLSLVENVNLQSLLGSSLVKELALAKQSLYSGFGMLFIKIQALTDETARAENIIQQMRAIVQSIQEAVQAIVKIMVDLAQEDSRLSGSTKRNSSTLVLSDSTSISSHSSLIEPPQYEIFKDFSIDRLPDTPSQPTEPIHPTSPKLYKKEGEEPILPPAYRKSSVVTNISQGSQTTANEEQSFLQYDYGPKEIIFTTDGQVKGGTLPALVERITLHDYFDMNFSNTFFLTYRSFCTSNEFLDLLEARFNISPPIGLSEDELRLWRGKKQKLIRLRVLNVLKTWLEQYYCDEDYSILERLGQFMTKVRDNNTFSANQIERLIQKRKDSCKDIKCLIATRPSEMPETILPRNLKHLKLQDINPTEMARQLTLIDSKLYNSIQAIECLNKAWSREDDAVHIQASIRFCNGMTQWASEEILSQPEIKKRSALLKYWVEVAKCCRQWNNFNTCMAILSAFDNSAIGRLKRTWEMVGTQTDQTVSQLRDVMKANRNFFHYRELVHSINPPCVPFVGIYLQDLTFIEDGNSDRLKPPYSDLINFAKRTQTAAVIQEIQQYQMTSYQFRPVEPIQNFIWKNLRNSRDEDQLYKESLKLEPKERDDEKIARLLYESGFL